LDALVPYVIVVGVALLVALAELLTTFGGNFFLALKSRWTYVLAAANVVVAATTYAVSRRWLNIESDLLLAALVGATYPVLLRSKFTVFRPVGSKDDPQLSALSFRMDSIYGALQERCYRQVDNAVAVRRTLKAQRLAGRSEAHLVAAIKQVIAARDLPAEREKDEQYVVKLQNSSEEDLRKFQIALFLIDIADGKEDSLLAAVRRLLGQKPDNSENL
jgi:hypothetical protein